MAKRKILTDNDPTLRTVCRPVPRITPRIITLLDDMIETMRDANGVGLAAPQIGVLRRVVVVETEPGNLIELINPVIIAQAGEIDDAEGCLSSPGEYGMVKRPEKVAVKALDRNGNEYILEGEGLMARAICHECDHLDGRLYKDLVSRMLHQDADGNWV